MRIPEPSFAHVIRLSDARGIFEHAEGTTPRRDGGYCLDDVARALLVVCRQRPAEPVLDRLAARYLNFALRAMAPDGRCHNRLDRDGRWEDQPGTGDWWGRALWGLGTAAAHGPTSMRATAENGFCRGANQRSRYLHAMAFAALGAAEVLAFDPGHAGARQLMVDLVAMVDIVAVAGLESLNPVWPWPLPRLTYADAAIAEALIAAGTALNDGAVAAYGLALLEWLLAAQTVNGRLSVTPVGGWGPGEARATFDQQPIEAAALADACARALACTGEQRWANGLERSVAWFLGDNDGDVALHDPGSGGGYDAVTSHGRNTNQGAESTLALISVLQHAKRISRRKAATMPDRASTFSSARPNLNPTYSSAGPSLPLAAVRAAPRSFGLLGTYPPTQCGIATFTRALLRSLAVAAPDDRVGVVRVLDAPAGPEGPEVAGHLRTDLRDTHRTAAEALNSFDVAVIQHEYGIYGGPHGDQVLGVLDQVRVPVLTVTHTVLARPTPRQESVLRQVLDASDAVVAMTDAARERLIDRYDVDPARVTVIRHGATTRLQPLRALPRTDPFSVPAPRDPLILTWGLLGPGKGIEWAIDALPRLRKLSPLPRYVVAGQTHPRVRQQQGESYREQLRQRAADAGVADMLRFEASYLEDEALTRLIRRADVVLLPYDSPEQVTSGVLVEAIAAGKPVIATAFPHAVEMCATGAGIVVAHRDSAALGEALHRVLTAPGLAQRMQAEAARIAPSLRWSAVADQYRTLAAGLRAEPTAVRG